MFIRASWPSCEQINPQTRPDAFWVECTPAEALGLTPELNPEHQWQLEYRPDWPLCFLISRDGQYVAPHEFVFPYSGMWNGYNPFVAIKPVTISSLAELSNIQIIPHHWEWPSELQA
ncbi:hypothetical protein ACFSC4_15570 [Deinococcus malanensis]|nr:hypothetical protein [Deinococcus malanensis]